MSYCRNNGRDSDVYVYEHSAGYLTCVGCDYITVSHKAMIGHLLQHRRKGDKVPDRALERLRRERREGYKVGDKL